MDWMFRLRGEISGRQYLIWSLIGFALIFVIWYTLTAGKDPIVNTAILPKPISNCDSILVDRSYEDDQGKSYIVQEYRKVNAVNCAYGEMLSDASFYRNLCLSLGFNFGGYLIALLWSIPIGFCIGLLPIFRASYESPVNAIRFIPLTAVTSIFIASFGLNASMKINFLAFGIMIYLIPIIIQRINEVKDVYLKTVYTIGASKWQTITSVYLPSVLSRLSDDLRVLTAISWTYIIVAESIGDEGGLGAYLFRSGQRMARPDRVFAILIIFIIIGILQDRLFVYLDKKFFPHKYQTKNKYSQKIEEPSAWDVISDYIVKATVWIFIGIYGLLLINQFVEIISPRPLLTELFSDTLWVIHTLFAMVVIYKVSKLFRNKSNSKVQVV